MKKEEDLKIEEILRPIPEDRFNELSRNDLIILLRGEQRLRTLFQEKYIEQQTLAQELKEEVLYIEGMFVRVKKKLFGKSSEKSPKPSPPKKERKTKDDKVRGKTNKLPSERYPNVPIIEKKLEFVEIPSCRCCGDLMQDSGMSEQSEYLTVIPKKYLIVRQLRSKYRCGTCHADLQTAPNLPRIKPGSSYSDEMMIDVALSKYCDLIPVERYVQMAARLGFNGLPPHSLIELTHNLADFVMSAYKKLRLEILSLRVLYADETPHKMLEGDPRSNWYLWGFSGPQSCYFECHDTRAGEVPLDILKDSLCEILLSDVYSGYIKAVGLVNKERKEKLLLLILMAYCNAHARRKFKDAENTFPNDVKFYLDIYKEIYKLEKKEDISLVERRKLMKPLFEKMKEQADIDKDSFSTKSAMYIALNYFSKNYIGLTLFLEHLDVPIDNNAQERNLRSPVVGRKTWYGTHSRRGAMTMAVLFSLVESCKLNKVNPREYFQKLTSDLHSGIEAYTPKEYLEKILANKEAIPTSLTIN